MSDEQLALVAARGRRKSTGKASVPLATRQPVVAVLVDNPLPHLDRLFDYAVPEKFADSCQPGVRVRVRFAGRLIDGYAIQRRDATEFEGTLAPIASVVSAEVVLTDDVLALCTEVAIRGACSLIDVVRAAVPPRHARAEAAPSLPTEPVKRIEPSSWADYVGGEAFVARVASRVSAVRAVWTRLPADVASLASLVSASTGGVIVIAPDRRTLGGLKAVLHTELGANTYEELSADLGPEARYRAFVRILRGDARVVIGTRAAVFAPVKDLQCIVVLDDTDDALIEPHAPYWNARDVAAIRVHQRQCSLLIGGLTRSLECQSWLESGWAKAITPKRAVLRERVPKVSATTEFDVARDESAEIARIPHRAWSVARDALRDGPVLVQVARRGYVMGLSCQRCRAKASCECGGPLASDSETISCSLCGTVAHGWRCRECGDPRLRAAVRGHERTAEELGKAFPGVKIVMSDAGKPVREVSADPAIVVSTPGMEPVARGGYSAVLILDATAALERAGLHSTEQAVARWFDAAALARPTRTVVITADVALPAVQALVRWDPGWFAQHEYAERVDAHLPPASRVIRVTGSEAAVTAVCAQVPSSFARLGPTAAADGAFTMVLMGPRSASVEAAVALHAALAVQSARSTQDLPTVRMDADLA